MVVVINCALIECATVLGSAFSSQLLTHDTLSTIILVQVAYYIAYVRGNGAESQLKGNGTSSHSEGKMLIRLFD